jgi:hypothetical protein
MGVGDPRGFAAWGRGGGSPPSKDYCPVGLKWNG